MGTAGLHRAVCHSQLPSLSRQPPLIGQMDDAMCGGRGGVCVGAGEGAEGRADVRAGASPSSPRSSLSHNAPPERRRLTGAGARTYWRAAWCAAALAGHRRSTVHEDDAAAVLQTVPRCNKVRKQGYLQQHCSYLC